MIQLTNLNEVNKFIGNVLVTQSELTRDNVYNALSLHGTPLHKRLLETNFISYDVSECVLLFELESENGSDNVSMTLDNGTIVYDKTYKVSITIYGNASEDVANKTIARLRSEKVRQDIQENGLCILNVTNSQTANEFVNDTMWHRSDFAIKLGCEIVIQPISESYDFDTANFEIIRII